MPTAPKRSFVQKFLASNRQFPVWAGLLAGLYPVLFYASNNFTLINTWGHFGYFALVFLIVPMVIVGSAYYLSQYIASGKFSKYIVPGLGTFIFLFLMHLAFYGSLKRKITAVAMVVGVLVAFFLYKQYKKVMVIQGILVIVGFVTLTPVLIKAITYAAPWKKVPVVLQEIDFDHKPNIYFIQPDGYVNFSELSQGYYGQKENELKEYLLEEDFKLYPDVRSNYPSTLSSNSAIFTGKHHYYESGTKMELYNARNTLMTENWVLNTLKRNGYKTHFITELPYLLLNRPKMGYDYCNISYDDLAYINTGLGERRPIFKPLQHQMELSPDTPKFFFVEIFNPGHISGRAMWSKGKEEEKKLWFESLDRANKIVIDQVSYIKEQDPNALIVILADHGGFVGLNYTLEIKTKMQDRDVLHSVFSTNLAIHWPQDRKYTGKEARSGINVFRMLFSYLSDDHTLMDTAQDDSSFLFIENGAPRGLYKVLDSEGNVTFEKH